MGFSCFACWLFSHACTLDNVIVQMVNNHRSCTGGGHISSLSLYLAFHIRTVPQCNDGQTRRKKKRVQVAALALMGQGRLTYPHPQAFWTHPWTALICEQWRSSSAPGTSFLRCMETGTVPKSTFNGCTWGNYRYRNAGSS